jgi:hypothetical protein
MIRSFKDRWSGVASFGVTITGEEAGDVVFYEVLVQVCEQVTEMLVGPASITGEEADEWVEYDETSCDAVYGLKEGGEIFWDGKGMMVGGVRL